MIRKEIENVIEPQLCEYLLTGQECGLELYIENDSILVRKKIEEPADELELSS